MLPSSIVVPSAPKQPAVRAMSRRPVVALLLGLFALGGCAAVDAPVTRGSTTPERKAVIFGSVTAATASAGSQMIRYVLSFRNIDTGESAAIGIGQGINLRDEPELNDPGRQVGQLFEIALSAGRYEFYSLSMVARDLPGFTRTFRSRQPFSLPFTVAAGQLAYLGEYAGYPTLGQNELGTSIPTGVYIVIRDQQRRDLALLGARRRGAASGDVVNIVPDPTAANTPLIRRTPLPPFDTMPAS